MWPSHLRMDRHAISMKFSPTIHGTGQDPVRGGNIDPLLVWRTAGGLLHLTQMVENQDQRGNIILELIERLEAIGAERLSEGSGPAAVLRWPGIAAAAIAHACEARGLNIAAADACLATKADGSVGWTALGRPEVAHEAVLITLDEGLTQERIKEASSKIEEAVKELHHLNS